jgi:hypothetical protein
VARKRHPNKEIEAAVEYAIENGWRYKKPGSSAHSWGSLLCPLKMREGCAFRVWSTPGNPTKHALKIRRFVDKCKHKDYVSDVD